MATCRDTVRRAMLEIKALASGEQPTADELSDGMDALQEIYDGLYGGSVGHPLADEILETGADLEADKRYLVYATAPLTVSFPDMPSNGARLQIKDMSGNLSTCPVTIDAIPSDIVLNTDNGDYSFVYVESAGTWFAVSTLTPDSEIPLGEDQYFRLELAKRIAPMFGGSLSPESVIALTEATNRIQARFFRLNELKTEMRSSRGCRISTL